MAYADQLKYTGRPDDAISAFKRSIALDPLSGEAWFRLGDVETYRFAPDQEAEMRRLSAIESVRPLNFHETKRAVMTPSAEQVRRSISTKGIDEWRAYESWRGPLKEALGPALVHWRGDAP